MSSLKLLPSDTVHRIASAQVITSVSTAVKELVENSLDGGATNIEIKLQEYGLDKIEVRDNGRGIKAEDAQFMAQRHCTSKISSFDNLDSLVTYGFRGEALCSLSAVSDVTITTKTEEDEIATCYTLDQNGKVLATKPLPSTTGTTVTACCLFKNLPVRKQFSRNQKKCRDELKTVEDLAMSFGLIHPGVRIVLRHNKSVVWQKNKCSDYKTALFSVLGSSVVSCLERVESTCDGSGLQIVSYLLKPDANPAITTRSSAHRYFVYVNKRPVVIKEVTQAIRESYSKVCTHAGNRHPVSFVSIEVPPSGVDVNLEPNKTRVLLTEKEAILNCLCDLLKKFYHQDGTTPGDDQGTGSVESNCQGQSNTVSLRKETSNTKYNTTTETGDGETIQCNQILIVHDDDSEIVRHLGNSNSLVSSDERSSSHGGSVKSSGLIGVCNNGHGYEVDKQHSVLALTNGGDDVAPSPDVTSEERNHPALNGDLNEICHKIDKSIVTPPKMLASVAPSKMLAITQGKKNCSLFSTYGDNTRDNQSVGSFICNGDIDLSNDIDIEASCSIELDSQDISNISKLLDDSPKTQTGSVTSRIDIGGFQIRTPTTNQGSLTTTVGNKDSNEQTKAVANSPNFDIFDSDLFNDDEEFDQMLVDAAKGKCSSQKFNRPHQEGNSSQSLDVVPDSSSTKSMSAKDWSKGAGLTDGQGSAIQPTNLVTPASLQNKGKTTLGKRKHSNDKDNLKLIASSKKIKVVPKVTNQSLISVHTVSGPRQKQQLAKTVNVHFSIESLRSSHRRRHLKSHLGQDCIIGRLDPSGVWLRREGHAITFINQYRIQEQVLFNKLMSQHVIQPERLEKPIVIDKRMVGGEGNWDVLKELECKEDAPDPARYIHDERMKANGFDIHKKIDTDSNEVKIEVHGITSTVPFYGVPDLAEILDLIRNQIPNECSLSDSRPLKILNYLKSEAVRVSRGLSSHMSRDDIQSTLDQMKQHVPDGVTSCLHQQPFFGVVANIPALDRS